MQKFDFCSPDMTEAPRKRKKTDESENGTETPVVTVAEGQSDVVAAIEKLTEQIGLIAERRKLDSVYERCDQIWEIELVVFYTGVICVGLQNHNRRL